jgi:RHS repeat-associated protein
VPSPVSGKVSSCFVPLSPTSSATGKIFIPPATEIFNYDLDGNLTGDGRWNYTWDAENRLIRLVAATSVGPQQRLDFEYDCNSRRIRKKLWNNTSGTGSPATDLKFLYDGWNLIAELNATVSDSVVRTYLWGTDMSGTFQGAGGVGGLLAMKTSSGVCQFTAYDGNGNILALVYGATGSPSAGYAYGPFGELLQTTGAQKLNPLRFSSKYTDDDSDCLLYGYRYYKPSTGRWMSMDPIEEKGGLNIYEFCLNNTLNEFDVDGRLLGYGMVYNEKLIPLRNLPISWIRRGDLGRTEFAKFAPTATPREQECGYEIALGGEAFVESRYYSPSPEAWYHELEHVRMHSETVASFNAMAVSLATGTFTKRKATCLCNVITGSLAAAKLAVNIYNNLLFDDKEPQVISQALNAIITTDNQLQLEIRQCTRLN